MIAIGQLRIANNGFGCWSLSRYTVISNGELFVVVGQVMSEFVWEVLTARGVFSVTANNVSKCSMEVT